MEAAATFNKKESSHPFIIVLTILYYNIFGSNILSRKLQLSTPFYMVSVDLSKDSEKECLTNLLDISLSTLLLVKVYSFIRRQG